MAAAWYATNLSHGMSALGPQQVLSLGSCRAVEVDQSYDGGLQPDVVGRAKCTNAIVKH